MSFSADSPYSLDISGDMTVTDESGIRLSSDSIRIKDDLTASHANASIELGSTGGEMNVSGNLTAGKDVIIKSKKNIVVGDKNKKVTLKATTGNVNLLAGTLDTDGNWTGGTGATESDQENNIAITDTNIIAAQKVDIMGGSVSITGAGESINSTGGDITIAAAKEFDGTTDTYTTEAGNQVSLSGETLLANNIYILGNKTDLNGTIQTDNLQAAAGETVAKDDTAKTLTNTAISEEGNALTLKGTVQGRENSAAGTIHLMGDIAIGDAAPATNTSLKSNKFLAEKLFGEGAKQAIDVLNIQNTDISVNAIGTKDINAGTINLTESSITVGSMDEHGINAEAIHLTDSELKATEASVLAADEITVTDSTLEGTENLNLKGESVTLQSTAGKDNSFSGNVNIDASETAKIAGAAEKKTGASSAHLAIEANNIAIGEDSSVHVGVTDISLKTKDLVVNNNVTAGGAMELQGETISIGSTLSVADDLSIIATDSLQVNGTVNSAKDIEFKGKTVNIGSSGGTTVITAGDDLSITAEGTGNSVTIQNTNLTSGSDASDKMTITGNGVTFEGTNTLSGTIEVNAADEASIAGMNTLSGTVDIRAVNTANITGTIAKSGSAELSVQAKNMEIGDASADSASIAVDKLDMTGTEQAIVRNATIATANGATLAGENVYLQGANSLQGILEISATDKASVTGTTVSKDSAADLIIHAKNVAIGGESADANIAVDKFTVSSTDSIVSETVATQNANITAADAATIAGKNVTLTGGILNAGTTVDITSEQASINGAKLKVDTQVTADQVDLAGELDAAGKTLTLNAATIHIGDGSAETSVTAKSIATVDATENLEINKAAISTDTTILKAQDAVKLKDSSIITEEASIEATGAEGIIQSTNTDIRITGEGKDLKLESKNVEVSGGSLSAATKNVEIKATDATLKGVINATGQDVKLNATNVNIGDGSLNTSVTASSIATVDATKNIETNKATLATDTAILKAQDAVELKDSSIVTKEASIEATGADGVIQSTNTDIRITGEGKDLKLESKNVEVSGGSLSAATKNVEIKATDATLKGVINAEGQDVELNATNVNIGDGSLNTSVTAKSIATVDATENLETNKAAISTDTAILKAQDVVKLKDSSIITEEASIEATGAEGIIQSTDTDISITGEDNDLKLEGNSVEISGGSLTAATKNVEIKATDGTTLKGVINAEGQDVKLNATNVNIGDGSIVTSVNAHSIEAVATGEIVASKAAITVDQQEGSISLLAARAENITTTPVPQVDDEGNAIFDENNDPVMDTITARTLTLDENNQVLIDNSRLDGADISLAGYSVAVKNNSAIYARKTLDALAGTELTSQNGGKLEVTGQAAEDAEVQNTVIQENSVIQVAGRSWNNFQPVPDPVYSPSAGTETTPETPKTPEPIEPTVVVEPSAKPVPSGEESLPEIANVVQMAGQSLVSRYVNTGFSSWRGQTYYTFHGGYRGFGQYFPQHRDAFDGGASDNKVTFEPFFDMLWPMADPVMGNHDIDSEEEDDDKSA